MRSIIAAAVLIAAAAAVGSPPVRGSGDPGVGAVVGTLFHDLDGDGQRGEGEPGLSGHPIELRAGESVYPTQTDSDGRYLLTAAAGDYTLYADTDFHAFFCVDSFGSFNPLSLNECMTPEIPWAFTTAQEVEVSVVADQQITVDFGVREMDIMLMAGRAFYQNGGSPPGTILEAFVAETKCGEAELMSVQGHNYELAVSGANETDGCAKPGDEVTFTINGLEALPTSCGDDACQPHSLLYEPTGSSVRAQSLVAIKDYAIYWGQELAYPNIGVPPVEGVSVSINGQCKEWPAGGIGLKYGLFGNDWVGTLVNVPSEEVWPGCGYPGAEVHFTVSGSQGGETGTVAVWEPWIHRIDIDLPDAVGSGDVNCDKDVDALDGLAFLRRLAALESNTDCWLIADVNCDGAEDVLDVLLILEYVAALPFELPSGCPPINQSGP